MRLFIATTPSKQSGVKNLGFALLVGLTATAVMLSAAYAGSPDSTSNLTPMAQVLCNIMYIIFGNLGRALAILAVCSVGVSALFGKASWGMAVTVALGISIVFGSGTIAILLLSSSGDNVTSIC